MRFALFIVVFHVFQRGESRLGNNVVALCARVVDRAVAFDREDVWFAVLLGADIQTISQLTF